MSKYDFWSTTTGEGITDEQLIEQFTDYMNENHDLIKIPGSSGGGYLAGNVLKEVDPVAFTEAFHDWTNSMLSDGLIVESPEELPEEVRA